MRDSDEVFGYFLLIFHLMEVNDKVNKYFL